MNVARTPSGVKIVIRFMIMNDSSDPLVIEDAHLIIYERKTAAAPLLAVGWGGDMQLTRSNSVHNILGRKTVPAHQGLEYDLAFKMNTNFDAARILFGVAIDWYRLRNGHAPVHGTTTSDAIYLLRYGKHAGFAEDIGPTSAIKRHNVRLLRINDAVLKELKAEYRGDVSRSEFIRQIEEVWEKHRVFRPERAVEVGAS